VLRGEVDVFHLEGPGAEKRVDTRGARQAVGHTMALDPTPRLRGSTLRAGVAGAEVLRVNGESFHAILNQHPGLAREVIRTLAQKLRVERDGPDPAVPAGPAA
jgi:CRP-like cAMP-binding protein